MDNAKIKKVLNELEVIQFFSGLKRFPKEFYKLNEDEQKEVVKRFRLRNGLDKRPPWKETK